jgi:hypothetical protein
LTPTESIFPSQFANKSYKACLFEADPNSPESPLIKLNLTIQIGSESQAMRTRSVDPRAYIIHAYSLGRTARFPLFAVKTERVEFGSTFLSSIVLIY